MSNGSVIRAAGRPSWWPVDYDAWPDERRAAFLERLPANAPLRLPYSPYRPTAKQEALLRTPALEVFWGGAAGGGKSSALLMAALQYVDVPGYAAILFRKTYSDLSLPGALMSVAQEWLAGSDARWEAQSHTWRFPSGATLTFGYLQTSNDRYRYQSTNLQFVGFDELTQFHEQDYLYLFSRLRKPAEGALAAVPLRVMSASNPGGPGGDWVRERFVDADTRHAGAVFIPARLDENPHLDQDTYVKSLMHLRGAERDRLLHGDWDAHDAGELFNVSLLVLAREWAPAATMVRYWDLAATEPGDANPDPDWSCGALVERGRDGRLTLTDLRHFRHGPGETERVVLATAESDGRRVPVWIEQEPGSSGKSLIHYYATKLPGFVVRGDRPTGDKVTRATPLAVAMENGAFRIAESLPMRDVVVAQLRAFPNGAHDDIVDALSGAYTAAVRGVGAASTSRPRGMLPTPGRGA